MRACPISVRELVITKDPAARVGWRRRSRSTFARCASTRMRWGWGCCTSPATSIKALRTLVALIKRHPMTWRGTSARPSLGAEHTDMAIYFNNIALLYKVRRCRLNR